MSFDRSLADQQTTCELIACFILSSWFLEAFNVVGFLWPTGDWGSGKAKLGMLICETAYLGEAVLSGSTFATLRDLADMGAMLLFDDAEGLASPNTTDPDKRSLLLAGNRRGATVAVKEPAGNCGWHTRYINAYCTRLFTATRLPDPVLRSRSIIVPLVRTEDAVKANLDVQNSAHWSCDRDGLLSDHWALALASLAVMPDHEAALNKHARIMGRSLVMGRSLEPWRPFLSVAHWLSDHADSNGDSRGSGLYSRMMRVATEYDADTEDLQAPDMTGLVVKSTCEVAAPFAPSAPSAPNPSRWREIELPVAQITSIVNRLAGEMGITGDDDQPYANERRVGKALSTLRLRHAPLEARSKGKRRR